MKYLLRKYENKYFNIKTNSYQMDQIIQVRYLLNEKYVTKKVRMTHSMTYKSNEKTLYQLYESSGYQ